MQDFAAGRFGQSHQAIAAAGQLGPGIGLDRAGELRKPPGHDCLQPQRPFGDAWRADGAGFGQRKAAGGLVKVGQRRHGIVQFPWTRALPVVGGPGKPGSQLPQMAVVSHKPMMVVGFQRQRNPAESLLVDVPQNGLHELQAFGRGIFGGPAAQAQPAPRGRKPPQRRPAKTVPRAEAFDAVRLAVVRVKLQDALDLGLDHHRLDSRWQGRNKSRHVTKWHV
jgi:hypothetical protein